MGEPVFREHNMREIVDRLSTVTWRFAEADANARLELERRIVATGRKRALITYSELVAGVAFKLPTVNEGVPFHVDTSDWRDIDRAILGEFLGYISSESYRSAGFFASALVVNKEDRRPSGQFFKWMRDLGVIRRHGEAAETDFWVTEVAKAHDWYAARSD